jgi:TPR repeat protein
MMAMGFLRKFGRAAMAGLFVMSINVGLANAGMEEDFTAAMVSYERGDFATAMPLMSKAADAGKVEAQVLMASMLDAAEFDELAVAYYRKAAAAGNLDGIYGLATMLASGEGVKKDPTEARLLLTKAADAGHKAAIRELAQAFIRGELDVTAEQKKGPEAVKWLSLSAQDGFMPALKTLEKAYREGDYGLAVDLVKAEQFKQAIIKLTGATTKKRRRGETK